MRVGVIYRERWIEEIKQRHERSYATVFFSFQRLPVVLFNQLRNNLKKENANIFVAKNTLIAKAFSYYNLDIKDRLTSSIAMAFVYTEEINLPLKVLFNFIKEYGEEVEFKILFGIVQGNILNDKELEEISKLPPRKVLLEMLCFSLSAPLRGFVGGLNQILLKFIWVTEALRNKKEQG